MRWRWVGVLGGKQTPEAAQRLLIYNLGMSHLHLPPSAICLGPEEEPGSLWIREPKATGNGTPHPQRNLRTGLQGWCRGERLPW